MNTTIRYKISYFILLLLQFAGYAQSGNGDLVLIEPDQYVKCMSNPSFTFTNATQKNCNPINGDTLHYQYWNFGNYWNTGHDSVLNWSVWHTPSAYKITYPNPGNYKVTLIDSSACGKDSVSITVSLLANPVSLIKALGDSVCQNKTIPFQNNSSAGFSYKWNLGFDSLYTSCNLGNNEAFFNHSGNFTVRLITYFVGADTSCYDTSKVNVSILQLPKPKFTYSISNSCDSSLVTFTDVSVDAFNWSWVLGNGVQSSTQTVAPQIYKSGTYPVQLSVTNNFGCIDTFKDTIRVFETPVAEFLTTNNCLNTTILFKDSTQLKSPSNSLGWQWDFGDNSPFVDAPNTSHRYTESANYKVRMIVKNGLCADTATKIIPVYPVPETKFSLSDTIGCSPLTVIFTNETPIAGTYHWDFGNGDSSQDENPKCKFISSIKDTSYSIRLIASNSYNCSDTLKKKVMVFGKPIAFFTSSEDTICSEVSVAFTNQSQGYVSSNWIFENGANLATMNSQHTFINSFDNSTKNEQVKLIVSSENNCKDTSILNITVLSKIKALFTVDTMFCSNLPVQFLNSTLGATEYKWTFGDDSTSIEKNPEHTFQNFGTGIIHYPVKLVATSRFGCKDSLIKTLSVMGGPIANFSVNPKKQTYPQTTVSIFNSTINAGNFSNNWNFGDAKMSNEAFPQSHTYDTWGTYIINLTTVNGVCSSQFYDTITILPPIPIANFSGSNKGCKPITVTFKNKSTYASGYLWKFGDGKISTKKDPEHTFEDAGLYSVTLIVTGIGGSDSLVGVDSVIVYDKPVARFSVAPLEVNLGTEPVNITNESQNSEGGQLIYLYRFGDNRISTNENPTHVYEKTGEYTISLLLKNNKGCVDSFEFAQPIRVGELVTFSVPNAFTPNIENPNPLGFYDPKATNNDVFHPVVTGMVEYEFSVYSRWGELLFESKDPKSGWDGFYKGRLCTQDVYIWKIKAKGNDGTDYNKTGDFLLIR